MEEGYVKFSEGEDKISMPGIIYSKAGFYSGYDFFSEYTSDNIKSDERDYLRWITIVAVVAEAIVANYVSMEYNYKQLLYADGFNIQRQNNIFRINDTRNIVCSIVSNTASRFDEVYADRAIGYIRNGINIYRNLPRIEN